MSSSTLLAIVDLLPSFVTGMIRCALVDHRRHRGVRRRGGAFLLSHPVEHSPLLTESDHLRRHPQPDADQAYGWWTDDTGEVSGAFLRAPRPGAAP